MEISLLCNKPFSLQSFEVWKLKESKIHSCVKLRNDGILIKC